MNDDQKSSAPSARYASGECRSEVAIDAETCWVPAATGRCWQLKIRVRRSKEVATGEIRISFHPRRTLLNPTPVAGILFDVAKPSRGDASHPKRPDLLALRTAFDNVMLVPSGDLVLVALDLDVYLALPRSNATMRSKRRRRILNGRSRGHWDLADPCIVVWVDARKNPTTPLQLSFAIADTRGEWLT